MKFYIEVDEWYPVRTICEEPLYSDKEYDLPENEVKELIELQGKMYSFFNELQKRLEQIEKAQS